MNAENKQRILAAVARWLDEHPDEPLPPGLDPDLSAPGEPVPDLLTLAASITACRHDVQLQGKLFRRLEEGVRRMLDAAAPATTAVSATDESFMDFFDRLQRCRYGTDEAARRLPWLVTRARATTALRQVTTGLDLVIERLRDHLTAAGIEAIDPVGCPFDPQCMRAIATEPTSPGQASGEVAQTLAIGYRRGEQLLRPAEVTIRR